MANTRTNTRTNTRAKRLGLTGNIGAGKSTVAELFRSLGLQVLDADEQARLITTEPEVLALLDEAFIGVVQGGVLDRAKLAARVFSQPQKLQELNAIIHPRVRAKMNALEAAASDETWIIHDIPLLFETGLNSTMDAVLVVDAPLETRIQRVMQRSHISREDILARDAQQMPAAEKRAKADFVINNTGNEKDLLRQVQEVFSKLN